MRTHYATMLLAILAGFLGGAFSSRLFNVARVEAADKKTFETLTTNHLIVSGDIVVQSTTASSPFVLKDGKGNSLELVNANSGFYLTIKNAMAAQTNIPAIVLSENGLAIIRTDGKGTTFGAQLSPDRLAVTYSDRTKTPWSTMSNTIDNSSVVVTFDDSKQEDLVHSTLSIDGFSYQGHGKASKLP